MRNAHGVIADVNEHYSAEQALYYRQPLRRYLYRYSLFSTSGFVPNAQSFALAHQISLIDLSGPAFEPLVDVLNEAAASLHAEASARQLQTFTIRKVRLALRAALAAVESETATREGGGKRVISPEAAAADAVANIAGGVPAPELASWAAVFAASLNASASGEGLILGFPPAPFILAMRPDNLSDFERYVDDHGPDIDVSIGFDGTDATEGDWIIEPRDHPEAFRLSFGLPGALETWLLSAPEGAAARAAAAKRELLSVISLFLEDRLVRLRFRPREVPAVAVQQRELAAQGVQVSAEASNASDMSYLRRTLKPLRSKPPVRDLLSVPDAEVQRTDAEHTGWSVAAVAVLMAELDGYGYVQADLLREAARSDGLLSRDDVYRVAEFSSNRSLRGLTRPPRRITGILIRNKMLPQDAAYPLQTRYESGVRATHFVVPRTSSMPCVAWVRHLASRTGPGGRVQCPVSRTATGNTAGLSRCPCPLSRKTRPVTFPHGQANRDPRRTVAASSSVSHRHPRLRVAGGRDASRCIAVLIVSSTCSRQERDRVPVSNRHRRPTTRHPLRLTLSELLHFSAS